MSVDAAVAAKVDWLLPLALGLLIGGFVFVVAGSLLLVFGAIGLSRHSATHPVDRPRARSPRRPGPSASPGTSKKA